MRTVLAFLVVTFAIPIVATAYFWAGGGAGNGLIVGYFSAVICFYAAVVLGLPACLFLAARGWTAFWIAPLTGFLVAITALYSIFLLLTLVTGGRAELLFVLTDNAVLRMAVWPVGAIGAGLGVVFWLIARPDRASP